MHWFSLLCFCACMYKDTALGRRLQARPYHVDSTASRPLSEVKQHRARLVLRWGTTLESRVLCFLTIAFGLSRIPQLTIRPLTSTSSLLLATDKQGWLGDHTQITAQPHPTAATPHCLTYTYRRTLKLSHTHSLSTVTTEWNKGHCKSIHIFLFETRFQLQSLYSTACWQ